MERINLIHTSHPVISFFYSKNIIERSSELGTRLILNDHFGPVMRFDLITNLHIYS